MQLSKPIIRIPKIVSKLALVLLLNTSKRFQTVINVYSAAFGTHHPYSKIVSNHRTCSKILTQHVLGSDTSVVIEY